jgi:DNA-binding NtrC family response regulator/tetratricopeptide (TPR) repeat protein
MYTRYTVEVAGLQADAELAHARRALTRGRGGEAAERLGRVVRSSGLTPDVRIDAHCMLAQACLLQGNVDQASEALGSPPGASRQPTDPARLSSLWWLHGQIAFRRGERSRAIALLGRALKFAEAAHDPLVIGLAHTELAQCYRHVGELAIVREHVTRATSALHAAGDDRHLALALMAIAVSLAQSGRLDEGRAALIQAERLAISADADDVLGLVCNNLAGLALIRHQHEDARALGERSVALEERCFPTYALAISLGTLGHIYLQLGELERAEATLHRALAARTQVQFHEITGSVYDSLSELHLIRGRFDEADRCLRQAAEAYGEFGGRAAGWYQWSLRVLTATVALQRAQPENALRQADEIAHAAGAPPADKVDAELVGCEALLALDRLRDAEGRLARLGDHLDPRTNPSAHGGYLRLRGRLLGRMGRTGEAYHDIAQSITLFDLIRQPYETGVSELALGQLIAAAGDRPQALRHFGAGADIFQRLGARSRVDEVEQAVASLAEGPATSAQQVTHLTDDAIVRRLVNAAVLPELLSRETTRALAEIAGGAAVLFVHSRSGDVRVLGHAGCGDVTALAMARASTGGALSPGIQLIEPLGRDPDGPRRVAVASPVEVAPAVALRLRTLASVARLGFELSSTRDQPVPPLEGSDAVPLEPLLPGFVCASAAMARVVDQIRHLQGSDLTVLITGESGTGKELVARAIHSGSPRASGLFLPFNCTTTTRDLADSQLFGHRRGSFTGAVTDQAGVIRSAAGGTLLLDEIGDLPIEVQPKLLRFLEQGEILPLGGTRPQRVDVRIVAATNADLERRVAEKQFREDLYYRLNVIRIHVPPLRERREEIPHLSALFLREACARLERPGIHLTSDTLALFAEYGWPGNVRQLRNEIQRAVAMSAAGGGIRPDDLARDLRTNRATEALGPISGRLQTAGPLGPAVEALERDVIRAALERSGGNISETARILRLTRRGLYLKLRRLGLKAHPVCA